MTRAKRHLVGGISLDIYHALTMGNPSVLLVTRPQCSTVGRF